MSGFACSNAASSTNGTIRPRSKYDEGVRGAGGGKVAPAFRQSNLQKAAQQEPRYSVAHILAQLTTPLTQRLRVGRHYEFELARCVGESNHAVGAGPHPARPVSAE